MSELSSDARALIEAGRFGDEPAGYDKARVRERMVRQLGVGAFAGTGVVAVVRSAGSSGGALANAAPHANPASLSGAITLPRGVTPAKLAGTGAARAGSALWVKSLGKVAAVATAAGALYSGAVMLELLPRGPEPAATPPAAQPAPELEPTTEPLVVTQPEPVPQEDAPIAADEASPARTSSKRAASPRGSEASSRRARREAREEAPTVAPAEAEAEAPRAPTPPAEAPAAEPAAASSLSVELGLLARAQRLLRDDQPQEALTVVREHAERFPEGLLQEERAGIEALAHCLLGETDAPSVEAFLKRSPGSPLAARVRKECRP